MPLISVIVPVYNSEPYLRRCVDSILAQSFRDFELILVDDGSTDSSGVICDEYAKADSRITVFHKENSGASSARNKGLNAAVGKLIVFCDSDDKLLENALSSLQMAQLGSNFDLIVSGLQTEIIDEANNQMRLIKTKTRKEIIAPREEYSSRLAELWQNNNMLSACGKVFRRELIEEYSLRFDTALVVMEDYNFVLKYIDHANGILSIDTDTYCVCDVAGRKSSLNRAKADYSEDVLATYHLLKYYIEKWQVDDARSMLPSTAPSFGAALNSVWQVPAETVKERCRKYKHIKSIMLKDGFQWYYRSGLKQSTRIESFLERHGSVFGLSILYKTRLFLTAHL